jgi:UDPglucose 6-dehydrogenase
VGDLERRFAAQRPGAPMHFACSPENLRLGNAIDVFTNPGRIVVGVRSEAARAVLEPMLGRFCDHLIWMSVESAEMAKHALNAFLATCITFTNELATLCERVGADAAQVEQALRSEPRVGPNAYVKAGSAFGGGTLARDVRFLSQLAERVQRPVGLIDSIIPSNLAHRQWPMRALQSSLGGLEGHTVGVLGLAYKPGTDAIRRSAAVDLCGWLTAAGARVRAHDPQVSRLPEGLVPGVEVCSTLDAVLDGAEAVVVATEWPEFKALSAQQLRARMARPLVVDPNQFVQATLAGRTDVEYLTIGKPA